MPNLRIDNRPVEVPPGATLLDAARRLGIEIPALCFLEGCTPSTSCMVCVVKVRNGGAAGDGRLVPSCAARAEDGMQVESETPEVHEARRTALELLLSDHPGDCIAPCQSTCPAHLNIPLMLRQTAGGDLAAHIPLKFIDYFLADCEVFSVHIVNPVYHRLSMCQALTGHA